MQRKNLNFIQGIDFDLIENLPKNGTKCLPIFDVSCEGIWNSKHFVKIATAGRHRGLNTIYIKHNLFHRSKLGRDVELQNTHIVLFNSPRDVLELTLSQQLGLASQLKEWCQDALSVLYGHLLNDLTPKTVDSLRYCSNSGSVPRKFYLPAGIETKFLDNEYTILLYSPNISKIFPNATKTIHSQLSKKFHSVSQRIFNKPIKRRASRSLERGRRKISKRNFRTNTKKNSSTQKKNYLKFN